MVYADKKYTELTTLKQLQLELFTRMVADANTT